jgi:hypothetical protein
MAPSVVRAQTSPSLDLRTFQPSVDPKGSLYMEPALTPGAGLWNVSGWFSYGYRPVVLKDSSGDITAKLISHQLSFDLLGNIGIGKVGALGFALPTVLYQHGESTDRGAAAMGGSSIPTQSLGDASIIGKATIVPYGDLGGFGLAALGRVTLPTGSQASFVAERSPTSEVRLLGEFKLIAVSVQGTAGFRLRTEERSMGSRTWGNEIPWGVGLAVRPQAFGIDENGKWTWVIEAHGALPAGPANPFSSAALSPAIAGASARYAIKDWSVLGGVEAPLDSAPGLPLVRAIAAIHWAPRVHDADHDGVPDESDDCLELAEDRDGFQDNDGCPDFDNDDDGVPDADDKCPTAQEDLDDFEDDDGCPDPDNDKDGILDVQDACPNVAGPANADPKLNGCPVLDQDGDKIPDDKDKCPKEPEDIDGFQDDDGCPDLDNDQDLIPDAQDACPMIPGVPSSDRKRNGCPIPDKDGDTFEDAEDKCPDAAEVWNGVKDDDGCPDEGGHPVIRIERTKTGSALAIADAIRFKGSKEAPEIDPKSIPTIRAIATELNHHPSWVAVVGVREDKSQGASASNNALSRAFAVMLHLRAYTYRDGAAETGSWDAVKAQPRAASNGLGILLLGADEAAKPGTPAPTTPSTPTPGGSSPPSAPAPRGP